MMWQAISVILQAVLGALFTAFRVRRQDGEHDAAVGGQAVDNAALETQEIVSDAADARAGLSVPPTNPDDLARQLRAERTGATAPSRRRRPF